MNKAIIVDLDGTLCDNGHRLHHITGKKKDWDAYNRECGQDVLNQWCADIVHLWHSQGGKVVLLTGRSDNFRAMTEHWLQQNKVNYDHLYMRKGQDFRPDTVVKREVYLRNIKDGYDVAFVLEDRFGVTKMWRENGLVCLQCADGNY